MKQVEIIVFEDRPSLGMKVRAWFINALGGEFFGVRIEKHTKTTKKKARL